MRNFMILGLSSLILLACSHRESGLARGISVEVEAISYPEILPEVTVLDFNKTLGLFLACEYFSGNCYLFGIDGEVMHTIEAPIKGSPDDYGRLSSLSFFDDESLLVISQERGISRIDLDGKLLQRYELPYRPTIFGGRLTKKARWMDNNSLVILLEGRFEPFIQEEINYPNPILEYWNYALEEFLPIIPMPVESKYRKGKGFDYYWPQFSVGNEGTVYYANENEPVLFLYEQVANTFELKQRIELNLPKFYEATQEVWDQNLFFYGGAIYLIEELGDLIYVFYHTGASNEDVKAFTGTDRREMYHLLMKNGVAIINRSTGIVEASLLPDEVQRVETILPNGLFVAKQNLYVNATEEDTNKRLLLKITSHK